MGFTTSYWQKERWSRRAADTLISYGRCWNPSLGNWDGNWRVGDQDCVRTAMKNHISNDKRARFPKDEGPESVIQITPVKSRQFELYISRHATGPVSQCVG